MSNAPQINVGTAWITVCNGMWHTVFIADDESAYPASCTCSGDDSPSAIFRKIDSLLDVFDESPQLLRNLGAQRKDDAPT